MVDLYPEDSVQKIRFIGTLLKWLRQDGHLIQTNTLSEIKHFISKLEVDNEVLPFVPLLVAAIDNRMHKYAVIPFHLDPVLNIDANMLPLRLYLIDRAQARDIAEQLTLIDFELFQKRILGSKLE